MSTEIFQCYKSIVLIQNVHNRVAIKMSKGLLQKRLFAMECLIQRLNQNWKTLSFLSLPKNDEPLKWFDPF